FSYPLPLLPRLLQLIAAAGRLGAGPAVGDAAATTVGIADMSGAEFKDRCVSMLCRDAAWPAGCAGGIVETLRDLPLSAEQLDTAVRRVTRHMRGRAALSELPPLSYQLLLLAGKGCKSAALQALCAVFDDLDRRVEDADARDARDRSGGGGGIGGIRSGRLGKEEVRSVEGTVLHHFKFAVSQDHDLGAALLTSSKRATTAASAAALTPFRVALLLSAATAPRLEPGVLAFFQDLVHECLVYRRTRASSTWLEAEEASCTAPSGSGSGSGSGGRNGAAAGAAALTSDLHVERVMLSVVAASRGWDHLVDSLLHLGSRFIEHSRGPGGRGAAGGGAVGGASPAVAVAPALAAAAAAAAAQMPAQYAARRTALLGVSILLETFKAHEASRRTVLSSVLQRIIMRAANVALYVRLLALLIDSWPNLVLDDAESVRGVFAYVSVLPPSVARSLLAAVSPLLCLRPQLVDHLVVPLKKALFSRDEAARLIGAEGLLLLLRLQYASGGGDGGSSNGGGMGPSGSGGGSLNRSTSTQGGSQYSQDAIWDQSQAWAPTAGGAAAWSASRALPLEEGFGTLRRCLSQQMEVRCCLYDGLLATNAAATAAAAGSGGGGGLELRHHAVFMLSQHLQHYFEAASHRAAPLLLHRCLDSGTGAIMEPLPALLACASTLAAASSASTASGDDTAEDSDGAGSDGDGNDGGGSDVSGDGGASYLRKECEALAGKLAVLSESMSAAVPEDFGLDKTSSFAPSTPAGAANLAKAALLVGSLEALMQAALSTGGSPPSARAVMLTMRLWQGRQRVIKLVQPVLAAALAAQRKKGSGAEGKGKGKSKGKAAAAAPAPSSTAAAGAMAAICPGYSATGTFALTLRAGGLPSLGLPFVEGMLCVLNAGDGSGSNEEGAPTGDAAAPWIAERDPQLHCFVLETGAGVLKLLGSGVSPEASAMMTGGSASLSSLAQPGTDNEHDGSAKRARRTAAKRATALLPLLLREAVRHVQNGNTSAAGGGGDAFEETAAQPADEEEEEEGGGKAGAKGKANGKGKAGTAKGAAKKGKAQPASLAELALSCVDHCLRVIARGSTKEQTNAEKVAKALDSAVRACGPTGRVLWEEDGGGGGAAGGGCGAGAGGDGNLLKQ
ncbi:unnamed protein product, partial [Phaeothamnion confervicola]